MKLSVLICTIPERKHLFNKLINELQRQIIECNGGVQIVSDDRERKQVSVGLKRNDLLKKSIGDYVCFIDDDDFIPSYYIDEILKAIDSKPDCVGFKIECDMEGKKESACSSNKYNWGENIDGFKYVRSIYHKSPIRRELAISAGFKDMRYAEDYDFSMRLRNSGLLQKEVYINKVMYYYNYKFENPKIKYGLHN